MRNVSSRSAGNMARGGAHGAMNCAVAGRAHRAVRHRRPAGPEVRRRAGDVHPRRRVGHGWTPATAMRAVVGESRRREG
jgi:hypothetical protein